jgi:hypothetical protein
MSTRRSSTRPRSTRSRAPQPRPRSARSSANGIPGCWSPSRSTARWRGGWSLAPAATGAYSMSDRDDALMLVRLLSRLLGQHRQLRAALVGAEGGRPHAEVRPALLRDRRLRKDGRDSSGRGPGDRSDGASRGQAGRARAFGRHRVAAGPVPGGGCWVWWDESALTAESSAQKREAERHQITARLSAS